MTFQFHTPWILFFLLPLGLTGCLVSPAPERPRGYLVMSLESNPTHLDPRYAMDANSTRIAALIFSSLTRTDENSSFRPDLAARWQMTDDRTYLFHLREGVTFHDGRPLTAADVKFTYDSILEPRNQSPKRGMLQAVKGVDQIAPYQVQFRLHAPYAPFLERSTLGIVPTGSLPQPPAAHQAVVGSGPFSLQSVVPGEKITLRASPSYWEGAPPLPGVIFKITPDAMTRALEFKKGAVDLLQNDIEPDMVPWLQRQAGASVSISQGTIFQYLGLNLDHPLLKRADVREAIAHAIDRRSIVRHLLKGLAVPATGLLSPLHWAYEPGVPRFEHDPERAKTLLDRAGLYDPDGDGPLPRFKLSYKTTTLDLRKRIAEAFKEQLNSVGIELDIRTYEWGTFFADIKNGNFHLYSLAWVGIHDPDIYFSVFHSTSVPPHGNNRGRYANAEIDRLLEAGRNRFDPRERKRVYSRVQKILATDLPYVPLWWMNNIVVKKNTVVGFVPYPDGDLFSLKDVSFDSLLGQR